MKKLQNIDKSKLPLNINSRVFQVLFFVLFIGLWTFVVEKGIIKKFILPSPVDIVITFLRILPDIKWHLLTTLEEAFIGFVVAIFFSVILALLMDNIKGLKKVFYPYLVVSQTIPIIALAPLFVIWFGFGQFPKILVVVLVCFFPIVINLIDGLSSVDDEMISLLKSMGASKLQIFKLLKFPASMVNFFSGLRIAATYSIMGAVIGEWLGGEKGLGVYMIRVKHSFALDKVFAVILIVVVLSLLQFKIISIIQKILMPWNWHEDINKKEII